MRIITYVLFVFSCAVSANSEEFYNLFNSSGDYRRFGDIEGQKPHVESSYEDGTTWKLWYVMLGTRSEGLHGELVASNGKLIAGKELGEKRVVQGVVFIWKGPFKERKNLFDQSGWLPEKLAAYSPSKKVLERASGKK